MHTYFVEFFLEWDMLWTKVLQKIKTHISCTKTFSPLKSCLLWHNVQKYCRARQFTDDYIIRRMRIACWIIKATNTHSEYLILIILPCQKWLQERALMLHYKHTACLVGFVFFVFFRQLCFIFPCSSLY